MRKAPMVISTCLLLCLGVGTAFAQSLPPLTSVDTLGAARADVLPGGWVVVSMDANGDLPGMVTLTLNIDGMGAITGGEWALVISSQQPGAVNPSAPAVEDYGEAATTDDPAEQVATLAGTVMRGGSIRMTADGGVTAVVGAQLVIDNATPNAPGIQGGYGRADAADLHDYTASYGSLSLTF